MFGVDIPQTTFERVIVRGDPRSWGLRPILAVTPIRNSYAYVKQHTCLHIIGLASYDVALVIYDGGSNKYIVLNWLTYFFLTKNYPGEWYGMINLRRKSR